MPLGRGNLPAIIQEVQNADPFCMVKVRLAREVVEMLDEGLQKELQAAALFRLERLLHRFSDCELVDVAHGAASRHS